MTIDLTPLNNVSKLLFSIPLKPVQGSRFQPTGFPDLGAATYETAEGFMLLVESAQSMANRLEVVCWDEAKQGPVDVLQGISHIRVEQDEEFLTDSILESHRINSPYILESGDKSFFDKLKQEVGVMEKGPVNRKLLAQALLKYDVNSLLHGVFLAKKDLAGGRLRLERALSAFIEAMGVREAASGGVKIDHVDPQGDTKKGFGHVPFHREEFTAESILLHVNLDLAQIRGYGLGKNVETMLVLIALYKLRRVLETGLRLRTACDLECVENDIIAIRPNGFILPSESELQSDLKLAVAACSEQMEGETTVRYFAGKKTNKNKE